LRRQSSNCALIQRAALPITIRETHRFDDGSNPKSHPLAS
jgi:hypothetical protein